MAVSRKDFFAVGKILRETKASEATINRFVTQCKAQNPRFDEMRFRMFVKGK